MSEQKQHEHVELEEFISIVCSTTAGLWNTIDENIVINFGLVSADDNTTGFDETSEFQYSFSIVNNLTGQVFYAATTTVFIPLEISNILSRLSMEGYKMTKGTCTHCLDPRHGKIVASTLIDILSQAMDGFEKSFNRSSLNQPFYKLINAGVL